MFGVVDVTEDYLYLYLYQIFIKYQISFVFRVIRDKTHIIYLVSQYTGKVKRRIHTFLSYHVTECSMISASNCAVHPLHSREVGDRTASILLEYVQAEKH